jgi:hypothetical protein
VKIDVSYTSPIITIAIVSSVGGSHRVTLTKRGFECSCPNVSNADKCVHILRTQRELAK